MPSYGKFTVCFPPVVWYSPPVLGFFIPSGLLSLRQNTLSPAALQTVNDQVPKLLECSSASC